MTNRVHKYQPPTDYDKKDAQKRFESYKKIFTRCKKMCYNYRKDVVKYIANTTKKNNHLLKFDDIRSKIPI